MSSEQKTTITKYDYNPFVPFHSDRFRISRRAGDYEQEWNQYAISPLEMLALHKSEKVSLLRWPDDNYVTPSGKEIRISNKEVQFIRDAYRKVKLRWKDRLDMDETTGFLWKTINIFSVYARNGHSMFKTRFNHTTDTLIDSLGLESHLLRKKRQVMTDDVFEWIDDTLEQIASEENPMADLLTFDGRPLLGINTLKSMPPRRKEELVSFLKGMVLFGYADNYDTRIRAREHFPTCVDAQTRFKIGGGRDLPFDMSILEQRSPYHIDFSKTAIDQLTQEKIIVFDPRDSQLPDVKNFYVRIDEDLGFSDIGGLVFLSYIYGKDAMLGGMIMDGIDVYKTYLHDPFYGNLAFYMSRYIEINYKNITGKDILTDQEKINFVYLGARQNIKKLFTSKSHRQLNQGKKTIIMGLLEDDDDIPLRLFFGSHSKQSSLKHVHDVIEQRILNFYERDVSCNRYENIESLSLKREVF